MANTRKYQPKKIKTSSSGAVSRKDIEKKLGEIDEIVQDASSSSRDMLKFALGVGIVVLVGVAFFAGRRRALRTKTVVSFVKAR